MHLPIHLIPQKCKLSISTLHAVSTSSFLQHLNPTLKHVIIQTELWMEGIEDEYNNTGAEIEGIAGYT